MTKEEMIDKLLEEGALDDPEADAVFLRTLPPEAAYLVNEEQAWIGCDHQHEWPKDKTPAEACNGQPHGKVLCLNMSDTFCYACGDAEEVWPHRCAEVSEVYKRFGPIGLVCWSAQQRNEDPVVEYTEDPVYQQTWKALYGDLKVEANYCNKVDPRWSDRKLNLKPWQPKEV
jgi:hypothetical protein